MRRWFRRLALTGADSPVERVLLAALVPLGGLYSALMRLRAWCYQRGLLTAFRSSRPVISIGNLALGGTGKTPLVDHLVRHLLQRGLRVAVVSRGYGGTGVPGVGVVARGDGGPPLLSAGECGDEPLLLARRNPGAVILVAARRRDGVELATREFQADVVILDDGFQHLAVARDLDLVLLDASRPFGNGKVFPAGFLREPPSALRRADLVLFSRSGGDEVLPPLSVTSVRCRHLPDPMLQSLDGSSTECRALAGQGVAFAGIADPQSFFATVRELGLSLQATVAFDDHAAYSSADLERLCSAAAGAAFFVTTQKDGVKLRADDLPLPCYQVPLRLAFEPTGVLEGRIDELLARGNQHDLSATP